MSEQSHRKADPAPTPAIKTVTPTVGQAPEPQPSKTQRDKGDKPAAQLTEE